MNDLFFVIVGLGKISGVGVMLYLLKEGCEIAVLIKRDGIRKDREL